MSRDVRSDAGRAPVARVATWLLALLLALQLAGLPHAVGPTPADARTAALASLAAAVGQPITLCGGHGDPSQPGGPAGHRGCEHCAFCHAAAAGIAPTPGAILVARLASHAAVERPRAAAPFVPPRRRGASSRGPPAFG